ncbi:MAG: glycosyltransferase family 2 protein [Elusimicrobia bacterium]|nr:glycosyltransferase family 2 protein [Elusimicrobiota bacterium]
MLDNLEIFIITYNRIEKLGYTLNRILEGPIKNYDIKILDNCSDDGTKEFCEDFIEKHDNFKYVRNKINIGLSGNIIRAMELASKKWLWILCDDDDYDWDNWEEIETALKQDYDIVHTTYSEGFRSEEYPYLINEEAFIPTCIYNTKHITPLTMQNAYAMAYTLLPHHAIGCKVINEKGKIFVPKKRCVLQGYNDKLNFIRMPKKGLFHKLDDYQLLAGYVGAYKLIEDENIRQKCNSTLCLGQSLKSSIYWFSEMNPRNNLYNVFEIILSLKREYLNDSLISILQKNEKFDKFTRCLLKKYILVGTYVKIKKIIKFIFNIKTIKFEKDYRIVKILFFKIKIKKFK